MQYPNTPEGDVDRLRYAAQSVKDATSAKPYAQSVSAMFDLVQREKNTPQWAKEYVRANIHRSKICTSARFAAFLKSEIGQSSFEFNMADDNNLSALVSIYNTTLENIIGEGICSIDPIEIKMMKLGHFSTMQVLAKIQIPKVRSDILRIFTRPTPRLEHTRSELREVNGKAAAMMADDNLRTLFGHMKVIESKPIALDDDSKEQHEEFMANVMNIPMISGTVFERLPLPTRMRMWTLKRDVPGYAKECESADTQIADHILAMFQKTVGHPPTSNDIDGCLFSLIAFRRLISALSEHDSFPHVWTP